MYRLKKRKPTFWLNGVICRLFHHIKTIDDCKFIDSVDGKKVVQYKCHRCKKRFMANSKNGWFRIYN